MQKRRGNRITASEANLPYFRQRISEFQICLQSRLFEGHFYIINAGNILGTIGRSFKSNSKFCSWRVWGHQGQSLTKWKNAILFEGILSFFEGGVFFCILIAFYNRQVQHACIPPLGSILKVQYETRFKRKVNSSITDW